MSELTAAERNLLAQALASPTGRVRPGRPCTMRLLLRRHYVVAWRFAYPSGWVITEAGRDAILAAPDRQSQASRDHHAATGRYYTYAEMRTLHP